MVLIQFGNAQFAAGNRNLGRGSYSIALELNRGLKKITSQCYSDVTEQKYELAIEDCSKALRINRYYAVNYYNRGLAYLNLEQEDQATADFTKAIGLIPVYTRAYVSRGFSQILQGQSDAAISDCSRAIELDEKEASIHPSAYQCLGEAFSIQENYDSALINFDKAIELGTPTSRVYFARGALYAMQGNYDLAISDFSRSIEIDPVNANAYIWRGNTFADTKNFSQAIVDYQKAISIATELSTMSYAYCVHGITYTKMGNFELAIPSLEQGVKMDVAGVNGWCKTALENARQGIPTP